MSDHRKVYLNEMVAGSWRLTLAIYFMLKHFPLNHSMLSSSVRLAGLLKTILLYGFSTPLCGFSSYFLRVLCLRISQGHSSGTLSQLIDIHHASTFFPLSPHCFGGDFNKTQGFILFVLIPFISQCICLFKKERNAILKVGQGLGKERDS